MALSSLVIKGWRKAVPRSARHFHPVAQCLLTQCPASPRRTTTMTYERPMDSGHDSVRRPIRTAHSINSGGYHLEAGGFFGFHGSHFTKVGEPPQNAGASKPPPFFFGVNPPKLRATKQPARRETRSRLLSRVGKTWKHMHSESQGSTISAIARHLGRDRKTVRGCAEWGKSQRRPGWLGAGTQRTRSRFIQRRASSTIHTFGPRPSMTRSSGSATR